MRIVFFLTFFLISIAFSQNLKVLTYTDSVRYNLGDVITVNYKFTSNDKLNFNISGLEKWNNNFEILVRKDTSYNENNKYVRKLSYNLLSFDSIVVIPSISAEYYNQTQKRIVYSDSFTVYLKPISIDTTKDIKDIKPPLEFPYDWFTLALYIIIIAILVTIIILVFRYLKRRNKIIKDDIIEIPFHEIALNKLLELENKKYPDKGMIKEYHSEISEIIREYIEKRFNVPALESTTIEIITQLTKCSDAINVITVFENFFNTADLVKFAKFIPNLELNIKMMESAKELIYATKLNVEHKDMGN